MTFEKLWDEVKRLGMLPEAANLDLPKALSEATKRNLALMSPQEVAKIFMDAISEVNQGSIETINSLVRKRL